jgi:hypothetical protein
MRMAEDHAARTREAIDSLLLTHAHQQPVSVRSLAKVAGEHSLNARGWQRWPPGRLGWAVFTAVVQPPISSATGTFSGLHIAAQLGFQELEAVHCNLLTLIRGGAISGHCVCDSLAAHRQPLHHGGVFSPRNPDLHAVCAINGHATIFSKST